MQERKIGCICELDADSGEPLVANYGECLVHKLDAITPKDTANDIYNRLMQKLKITDLRAGTNPYVKECAEYCVDEILSVLDTFQTHAYAKVLIPFYNEVKKEIQNL